jgi:predicted metal-binding protein
MDLGREPQHAAIEAALKDTGFTDFKWIDPKQIVVAQWVRMKCMFGCPNYGRKAACPPQTPSVTECERFFREYQAAVVLHLRIRFDHPKERYPWYKEMTLKTADLERKVFMAGFEKAFVLSFSGCTLCQECKVERSLCKQPQLARPAPEAMAVDVYSTVKSLGFPIAVRTEYAQEMDRYALLMIR